MFEKYVERLKVEEDVKSKEQGLHFINNILVDQFALQTQMESIEKMTDAELYELISQWVEVLVTKNGYCAQSQLRINLQDLDKYAKGSKQVKVDILRMAVKTGWKDITYCINDYDKEIKSNTRNSKENQYQANETKEQKAADMQAVKDKICLVK